MPQALVAMARAPGRVSPEIERERKYRKNELATLSVGYNCKLTMLDSSLSEDIVVGGVFSNLMKCLHVGTKELTANCWRKGVYVAIG